MIDKMLRVGRVTKFLPYMRGFGVVRNFYELVLPRGNPGLLHVEDFDGDLKMDVDVREYMGFNVWHRPRSFEKTERKLFCSAVFQGCTVLDVGANIGIYSLLAAKRGARVFAIEADPNNFQRLRHHIQINKFDDRITAFQIAAGSEKGTLKLFRNPSNCGGSSLFAGVDPVLVPEDMIDSLDLPPIDVCKMDIEGAELIALLGMERTIKRSPNMKMLLEYNERMGQTSGMMELLCSWFENVYIANQLHCTKTAGLTPAQKLPSFCNLWACRHSLTQEN